MLALEFRGGNRHVLFATDFGDGGFLRFCLGYLRERGQLTAGHPLRRMDGAALSV
jgi:hypothetical protein